MPRLIVPLIKKVSILKDSGVTYSNSTRIDPDQKYALLPGSGGGVREDSLNGVKAYFSNRFKEFVPKNNKCSESGLFPLSDEEEELVVLWREFGLADDESLHESGKELKRMLVKILED